jgi:extracellular factor (EF) 3-hydroxypalmitic acid methyl ester biosynthesis protein
MDILDGPKAVANYGTASFLSTQGLEVEAPVTHLTRNLAVLVLHNTAMLLRTSEVLPEFKLRLDDHMVYSGRAVVLNIVLTGTQLVVEATLEEGWIEGELAAADPATLQAAFAKFLEHWQKIYRIQPEFKVLIADMQTFLTDLRIWLEQIELGIRSSPSADRVQLEQDIARGLSSDTTSALTGFFERFEEIARRLEPELRPIHRAFSRRHLHPLLLCAPFLYRTFQKPLGFAGDYEMVNMILRDPFEGGSLFAKLMNFWFLQQPPAEAHRNRIEHLQERLTEVTVRAASAGRTARMLSLGCGSAHEVQRFIETKPLADRAHFTLLDFSEETLDYTRARLEETKRLYHRTTSLQTTRKSVNSILKEAARSVQRTPEYQFDFVYCAGLFDYLSDQMCHRLSNILYDWVQPGGLFLTTNVDPSNPRRLVMDFVMEWNLIYRDGRQLAALRPDRADPETASVKSDLTGVNVYYEARKSDRA